MDTAKEWNPKMAPYILYAKYGYHIFDLVKTSKLLRLAGNVLPKKAEKEGNFICRNKPIIFLNYC